MGRKWLIVIGAVALSSMIGLLQIDPIRWSLPKRYLYSSFDIYRSGSKDFNLCMKVPLTKVEAREFVRDRFDADERISHEMSVTEARCPAQFWPADFHQPVLAFRREMEANGYAGYSSGAVFQDGHLYYWAWEM